jgi:hypothetical protein
MGKTSFRFRHPLAHLTYDAFQRAVSAAAGLRHQRKLCGCEFGKKDNIILDLKKEVTELKKIIADLQNIVQQQQQQRNSAESVATLYVDDTKPPPIFYTIPSAILDEIDGGAACPINIKTAAYKLWRSDDWNGLVSI